jgi:methylisocitrate lyase
VFVEALASVDEMRRVCAEVPGGLLANMAPTGVTPLLTASELAEIGFSAAIFPGMTAMAAMAVVERALRRLKETGDSRHPELEVFDFARACRLLGFDGARELAARWEALRPPDAGE